jgi:predicted Zn-dependent protease
MDLSFDRAYMARIKTRARTRMKARRRAAVLALLVALPWACATTPTGRRQLLLVPDSQMDALGQEAFEQIKQQENLSNDPAVNRYVQCVADALTSRVEGDGDVEWQVVVFANDEMVNAFALPGGRIGVYTGLLRTAKTPAQLAAVVGHEIAHVLARHSGERVSQEIALGMGLEVLGAAMGNPQTRAAVMGALGVGAQVGVLLPYSRKHEAEADEIGQLLMADAGFDPRESVTLWENMAKAAGESPPEFLSTHPTNESRIKHLQDHLNEAQGIYREARQEGRTPNCKRPAPTVAQRPDNEPTR